MGATSGTGTAFPSSVLDFTPGFIGICVAQTYVFCAMLC